MAENRADIIINADSTQVRQAGQDIERLAYSTRRAGESGRQASGGLGSFDDALSRMRASLGGLQALLGGVLGGFSLAHAVKEIGSFESAMINVKALTGANAQELAALEKQSRALGASTAFNAQQAAEAQGVLASAGMRTNEILSATPGILNLAAAGNLELANAAEIATGVMSGLGLQLGDLGRINDVLVKTAADTKTSVQDLGAAMQPSAAIAKTFGIDLETLSAVLGTLADNNIKGSEAGNNFKAMLVALGNETKENTAILEAHGLSYKDLDVQARGLVPVLETLRQAHLSGKEALQLFGSDAANAALILSENSPKVAELAKALRESEGAADAMAAILNTGLNKELDAFYGSVSEAILQVGDAGLTNALSGLITTATNVVTYWSGNFTPEFIKSNKITDESAASITRLGDSLKSLVTFVSGIAAFTGAIWALRNAVAALNFVLALNPFVAIGGLIAGAGTLAYSQAQKVKNEVAEAERLRVEQYRKNSPANAAMVSTIVSETSPAIAGFNDSLQAPLLSLRTLEEQGVRTFKSVAAESINSTAALSAETQKQIALTHQKNKALGDQFNLEVRLENLLDGKYKKQIIAESQRQGLDPRIALTVAALETNSGTNIRRSPAGAQGLMQIMPGTAAELTKKVGLTVQQITGTIDGNIKAGVAYLKEQSVALAKQGRSSLEGILASYNAGRGNFLDGDYKKFKETTDYVKHGKQIYQALSEAAAGFDEFSNGAQKAEQATFKAVTANEQYLLSIVEAEDLLVAGQISQSGYNQLLDEAQAAYDQATGATDKYTAALKAQEQALATLAGLQATLSNTQESLALAMDLQAAGASTEEIKKQIDLLQQYNKVVAENPGIDKGAVMDMIEQQAAAAEKLGAILGDSAQRGAQKGADAGEAAYKRMWENIQDAGADMFYDLMTGGDVMDAVKSLGNMIQKTLSESFSNALGTLFDGIEGNTNWTGIFGGIVSVAGSWLTRWLSDSGKADAPSMAQTSTNKNILGLASYANADKEGRYTFEQSMLPTIQKWSSAVNSATAIIRDNAGTILNFAGKYLGQLVSSLGGSGLLSGIKSLAGWASQAYTQLSGWADELVSGIGTIVSNAWGALTGTGAAAAGQAGSGAASQAGGAVSQVAGYAAQVLAIVQLGWDLYNISQQKFTSTLNKVSQGFYAAESAAVAALGVVNPIAWVVGGILRVAGAITQMASGDWMGGASNLFGGHIGGLISDLFKEKPSATVLAGGGAVTDKGASWQNNGEYFTSHSRDSASVGLQTDFGWLSMRMNAVGDDWEAVSEEAVKSFLPLLRTTQAFDRALATSISITDDLNDQEGQTLAMFNRLFKQTEKDFPLDSLNSAQMITFRMDEIAKTMGMIGTKAGDAVSVWWQAFSSKLLKPDSGQNAEYNQMTAFNIEAFIAAKLPELAQLPKTLADLFVQSVTSVADGATQEQFQAQFTDFFAGWEYAKAGLNEIGIQIEQTAIPQYLSSLVGLGLTVGESAQALVSYASTFDAAAGDVTAQFNAAFNKIFADAKALGYDKAQTSGYVGSYITLANTASDMGLTATNAELDNLAKQLNATAIAATTNANAVVDAAIAENNLTGITREAAIQQLVLAGKLDESKIAAADFSTALVDAQRVMYGGIEFAQQQAVFFGTTVADMGLSFSQTANIGANIPKVFKDIADAMQFLDSVAKAVYGDAEYAAGKQRQAQATFDSSAGALGFKNYTVEDFGAFYRDTSKNGYVSRLEQALASNNTAQASALRNLGTAYVTLTTANDQVTQATQSMTSYNDSAASVVDHTKELADLQKQVSDELAKFGKPDIVNALADINAGIDDMIAKATEYGGTLNNIEQLRQNRLQQLASDTAKPVMQEYGAIGKTSYQQAVDKVKDDMATYWQQAEALSAAGLLNFADAQHALQAIELDRLNKIQQKLNDIISGINTTFSHSVLTTQIEQRFGNTNISSFATELLGLSDTWTQTIKEMYDNGADAAQILSGINTALATANLAFDKAKRTIQDFYQARFDTINTKRTDIGDKIIQVTQGDAALQAVQQERALSLIRSDNFDKQMQGIDLLQSVTMDNLQAQLDAAKNIKAWVDGIKLGDKSPLTYTKQLAEAQQQFEDNYAKAQTGDKDALGKITTYADNYLSAAQRVYASSPDYVGIFNDVTGRVEGLGEGAADIATQTLTANNKQVELLQQQLGFLDQIANQQTTARDNELNYLGEGTRNVGNQFIGNLQQLADAVGSAFDIFASVANGAPVRKDEVFNPASAFFTGPQADPLPAYAASQGYGDLGLNSQNLLDNFLAYYPTLDSMAGVDPTAKTQLRTAFEIAGIEPPYAFAKGGYYPGGLALVGEEGPELINFNNPGQVYTAPQTQSLLKGGNNEETNDLLRELIAELRELRKSGDSTKIAAAVDRMGAMLDQRTHEQTQAQREATTKAEARRQAMATA